MDDGGGGGGEGGVYRTATVAYSATNKVIMITTEKIWQEDELWINHLLCPYKHGFFMAGVNRALRV